MTVDKVLRPLLSLLSLPVLREMLVLARPALLSLLSLHARNACGDAFIRY